MLLNQKHTRNYPILQEGSKVKIYRKTRIGEKSHTSYCSENTYEVEKIEKTFNQPYFKLNGLDRLYLRSELLKV